MLNKNSDDNRFKIFKLHPLSWFKIQGTCISKVQLLFSAQMTFSGKINSVRRAIMQGLTKNVGTSQIGRNNPIAKDEIKRILICRPNHRLGNLLLITPLIQDVADSFPDSKIDLLTKGNLAPTVFKNYSNVNAIIQFPKKPFKELIKYAQVWLSIKKTHYDLVINVIKDSSSGRLSARFAHSKYKFFGENNEDVPLNYQDTHIARQPVYYFRYCLAQMGLTETNRSIPLLDLKLSPDELAEGKKKLKQLINNDNKTICLFTYATGDKCYPKSWWEIFYERLKTEYPDYNIIEVLGVENISNISFNAPTYSDKDIRKVGAFIANTSVFIGADSGVMHLASAVQIPTIGFFSITPVKSYEPYNPDSVGINTNSNTGVDDYIRIINGILT